MSDTKEKPQFDVKQLPELDESLVNRSKEKVETFKEIFTPPEGKKLVGTAYSCSKHGDISQSALPLNYVKYYRGKDDKVTPILHRDIVCLPCLTEALGDIWNAHSGKEFGMISESPIFDDLTEEDVKKMEEQKEQKKAESKKEE